MGGFNYAKRIQKYKQRIISICEFFEVSRKEWLQRNQKDFIYSYAKVQFLSVFRTKKF